VADRDFDPQLPNILAIIWAVVNYLAALFAARSQFASPVLSRDSRPLQFRCCGFQFVVELTDLAPIGRSGGFQARRLRVRVDGGKKARQTGYRNSGSRTHTNLHGAEDSGDFVAGG
jgi:hypothetical protein